MVNEFVIKFANTNGTGSSTANGFVAKAIHRMGVPISPKNLFPSNIQGLPTWYVIRVSGQGHVSYSSRVDIMVAMNPQTYKEDLAEITTGGCFVYDNSWPLPTSLRRDDVKFLGLPLAHEATSAFKGSKNHLLMKNMIYVGALVHLMGLSKEIMDEMMRERFKGPRLDQNMKALEIGERLAREALQAPFPFRVSAMKVEKKRPLMDGNSATALGALCAGASVASWYPITPSTSVMEAFEALCEKYRRDPSGKNRYLIVQSEDELSAIGTVLGAQWAGSRAFTATSGPGVSLMSELLGFAYYAEIPVVLINVQRVGPSTGMPTRTQQGDLLASAYLSHGDTKHILLFPSNPEEAFLFTRSAFDFADRYQTPVMVLSDLDIGMNEWVTEPLSVAGANIDRGKIFPASSKEKFYRYLDVDLDGIGYRTFPGESPSRAYFTRGSGHNRLGQYTESADEYVEVMDRIKRKIQSASDRLPGVVVDWDLRREVALVAYGSSDLAVREARERLEREGILTNYMRICSFPFSPEVEKCLQTQQKVIVIEQNRDGQMRSLLTMETSLSSAHMDSILYYGGFPLSGEFVYGELKKRIQR